MTEAVKNRRKQRRNQTPYAVNTAKFRDSEDEAYLFHLEMWLYVHGIATMIATSYLDWDDEFISRVLTDAYMGLKYRYTEGKDNAGN